MKPILCDTCINCEREIEKRQIPLWARSQITKTITEITWYCKKKGRYAQHHERYNCPDYANKTLEEYQDVK